MILVKSALKKEFWLRKTGLPRKNIKKSSNTLSLALKLSETNEHLKDVIPGMCYHHERTDGSGYPEGLKDASIPLIAKIIAVADAYDAMTTNRPYQGALDSY